MATAARPPHSFSPSYVPRSRPASPALPPIPTASTSNGPSRPTPTPRPRSTPGSPLVNAHSAPQSSPLVNAPPRSSPVTHPIPTKPRSPALTPRLGDRSERRGSGLKHELRNGERSAKKLAKVDQAVEEGTNAILKILAGLPAPLPETLPPTFLPTPSTTPSPTRSFADWAKSSKRRRSLSGDSLPSSSGSASSSRAVGLGLGLSLPLTEQDKLSSILKKRKISVSPPRSTIINADKRSMARFDTPRSGTPLDSRSGSPQIARRDKEGAKSGLRNEWVDENGMSTWTKERWAEMGKTYRDRALGLKRLGDAHLRYPSAKPEYLARAPAEDHVRGLLCLTDSILMWLFAYWCEEQGLGRVRTQAYKESKPLRDHVKSAWEGRMRRGTGDEERDGAKGMVGLMHLIEAVISYHTSADSLSQLSRKSRQLDPSQVAPQTPTQSHSSHATSTSYDPAKVVGPSPSATTASPAPSGHSNESHNSHNSHGSNPISDLLPLIAASTSTSVSASRHLLNSRHHLSLSLLRSRFPQSFELAIHSELADQALPAPGDLLGSAKRLDIDDVDVFAWPIELGMHAPVAHVSVFGRCLVKEYEEGMGGWEVREA